MKFLTAEKLLASKEGPDPWHYEMRVSIGVTQRLVFPPGEINPLDPLDRSLCGYYSRSVCGSEEYIFVAVANPAQISCYCFVLSNT